MLTNTRTAYPLLQSFTAVGEFTFFERVRAAIKENLIFYSVCGTVLGVIIIYIAAVRGLKA